MSDTDSFIEEVTEEVRRDRLYALLRRYGWIAVLAIVTLVGGAAINEYRKAQATARAEALGDAIIEALRSDDPAERAASLAAVEAQGAGSVVLAFAQADAQLAAGDADAAAATLEGVVTLTDMPQIYRDIAAFKAVLARGDSLAPEDRRLRLEALAQPGAPLRLLAGEQLALLEVEEGDTTAALTRLEALFQDAEATPDLQQRIAQVIVALGGTVPEVL